MLTNSKEGVRDTKRLEMMSLLVSQGHIPTRPSLNRGWGAEAIATWMDLVSPIMGPHACP